MSSTVPVLGGDDASAILLDHIRRVSGRGVPVDYGALSVALGCSRREAEEALFEFCYRLARVKHTAGKRAAFSAPVRSARGDVVRPLFG